jgi:hypothetical protein
LIEMSSPPPKEERVTVQPDPRDEADVRADLNAAEAAATEGALISMTGEQFETWMTTGEGGPWPGSSRSGTGT